MNEELVLLYKKIEVLEKIVGVCSEALDLCSPKEWSGVKGMELVSELIGLKVQSHGLDFQLETLLVAEAK